MNDLKPGALCWNQYTTWPALLEAGQRVDQLGYDTLWTWDQLQSSIGPVSATERDLDAPQVAVPGPSALDGPVTHADASLEALAQRIGVDPCSRSLAESG